MEEMTIEQQKAVALAAARARAAASGVAADGGAMAVPEGSEGASQGFQRAGGYGAFGAGVAGSAIKGYMGLKQFFGGLSDEDQAILREIAKEEGEDPDKKTRLAGTVVGAAAPALLPGVGWGNAGRAALPMLAKAIAARAPMAGGVAGAGAASGATSMALSPGEGSTTGEQFLSKAKHAGVDALLGGGIAGAGGLVAKPFTGMFEPTFEAAKLFSQGVNPTLQQGAESRLGKFIGGLASGSSPVRARQEKEVEDALIRRITGKDPLPGGPSRADNVDYAEGLINSQYAAALRGKTTPINQGVRGEVADAANVSTRTNQFLEEAARAQRIVLNVIGDSPGNINVGGKKLYEEYIHPLTVAASRQSNERVRDGILAARQVLLDKRDARLTPEQLQKIADIDVRNFDLSRLREASMGAGAEKEGASLAKLESAYSNAPKSPTNTTADDLIGPATRVLGSTPTQDMQRSFLASVRRATGTGLGLGGLAYISPTAATVAGGVLAPMYATSLVGQTAKGAKILMGQTDKQKALAELLRKMPEGLGAPGYSLSPDYGEQR